MFFKIFFSGSTDSSCNIYDHMQWVSSTTQTGTKAPKPVLSWLKLHSSITVTAELEVWSAAKTCHIFYESNTPFW